MTVSSTLWTVSLATFISMFVLEFIIIERRAHAFTFKEAISWVIFYVYAAVGFGSYIWWHFGHTYGQQFFAGWLTEYSLSVDNLFVFAVILSSFAVPAELKHRVLSIGILIAIGLRAILILVGVKAIQQFESSFYLFGVFLLYLGWHVWRSSDEEPDPDGNAFIRWVERHFRTTRHYDGHKWLTKLDGRRVITPMLLVILAIGTTDLIFAIDSIPAVLGLTREYYLVVAVNVFALFGLRQLFFILDGLLGKVRYLTHGLAIILALIGVKLILEAVHATTHLNVPQITSEASLAAIVTIFLATVGLSLYREKRDPLAITAERATQAIIEADAGVALEELSDDDSVQDTDQNS